MRAIAAPLRFLVGHVRRSPRLRWLGARGLVLLVVGCVVGGAVGVILLNNTVIARTAELGKLEERRRELRRENALLGAQAAKLSAPPKVQANARTRLGMVQSASMPHFIYLDRTSRRLTPEQARAIVARRLALQQRAAARQAAVEPATVAAKDTAAVGTR